MFAFAFGFFIFSMIVLAISNGFYKFTKYISRRK